MSFSSINNFRNIKLVQLIGIRQYRGSDAEPIWIRQIAKVIVRRSRDCIGLRVERLSSLANPYWSADKKLLMKKAATHFNIEECWGKFGVNASTCPLNEPWRSGERVFRGICKINREGKFACLFQGARDLALNIMMRQY